MKTAVQILIEKIEALTTIEKFSQWRKIKQDAIELNKQQIIEAHSLGVRYMATNTIVPNPVSERYFDKTYGG